MPYKCRNHCRGDWCAEEAKSKAEWRLTCIKTKEENFSLLLGEVKRVFLLWDEEKSCHPNDAHPQSLSHTFSIEFVPCRSRESSPCIPTWCSQHGQHLSDIIPPWLLPGVEQNILSALPQAVIMSPLQQVNVALTSLLSISAGCWSIWCLSWLRQKTARFCLLCFAGNISPQSSTPIRAATHLWLGSVSCFAGQ